MANRTETPSPSSNATTTQTREDDLVSMSTVQPKMVKYRCYGKLAADSSFSKTIPVCLGLKSYYPEDESLPAQMSASEAIEYFDKSTASVSERYIHTEDEGDGFGGGREQEVPPEVRPQFHKIKRLKPFVRVDKENPSYLGQIVKQHIQMTFVGVTDVWEFTMQHKDKSFQPTTTLVTMDNILGFTERTLKDDKDSVKGGEVVVDASSKLWSTPFGSADDISIGGFVKVTDDDIKEINKSLREKDQEELTKEEIDLIKNGDAEEVMDQRYAVMEKQIEKQIEKEVDEKIAFHKEVDKLLKESERSHRQRRRALRDQAKEDGKYDELSESEGYKEEKRYSTALGIDLEKEEKEDDGKPSIAGQLSKIEEDIAKQNAKLDKMKKEVGYDVIEEKLKDLTPEEMFEKNKEEELELRNKREQMRKRVKETINSDIPLTETHKKIIKDLLDRGIITEDDIKKDEKDIERLADNIFNVPDQVVDMSNKLFESMKSNAKFVADELGDDFLNRTIRSGTNIINNFGRTLERMHKTGSDLYDFISGRKDGDDK